MEELPLGRIAALVPEFAVKDLPLGRTMIMMMTIYIYILHIIIHHHQWHYSPIKTFASSMSLFQTSLSIESCSQFFSLDFSRSWRTQSHHLFLGLPLNLVPWCCDFKICFTFLLFDILLICPIHVKRPNLTFETISGSPSNCIILYYIFFYTCYQYRLPPIFS